MVTWKLNDLLNIKDLEPILVELNTKVNALAKYEKKFNSKISINDFKKILFELELINNGVSKLGSYASNWFSENSKNQKAISLRNRIHSLNAEFDNKLLFISQRWKDFDEKNAQRIIKALPDYAYYLKQLRTFKKHTLTEVEEKIITVKDIHGADVLPTIYKLITTSFIYKVGRKELSQSEVTRLVRSPKSKLRKEAYDALLGKYSNNKEVLGELYKHVAGDWHTEMKLRNYKSPISIRNKVNDLPDEAINALLKSVKKNAKIFQKYFEKKAKLLGIKNTRYNLYAPLNKTKENIPYDEAVKIVLDTFKEFNKDFYFAAKRIVDDKHIHSNIQPNKYTGAYCNSPAPKVTPYILLSYTGDAESVSTLAHELGHGVHAILAENNNSYHYDAPLPICETASIFSELLLAEKMKKENPKVAKAILATQIDGFFASILRQVYFVLFEIEAHNLVEKHASVDELAKVYGKLLKEQFGKMEVPELFNYEWLYIPHIYHTPFYCYAYAFGNLLSLSFYAKYKENPKFANKIVEFLAKGGSENPANMIKKTGFKLDEAFWQSGFDVIKEMIKDF